MKTQIHLTALQKKVFKYMLDNNLTYAKVGNKSFEIKILTLEKIKQQKKEIEGLKELATDLMDKVAISMAIKDKEDQLNFLKANERNEAYFFCKQLVINKKIKENESI